MLQPSEVVTAKLLPTIRARLAQVLLLTYGMTQVRVARALGLTQAAVSHYNTKSRGLDTDLLHRFPEIEPFALKLAERIHEGMARPDQIRMINEFCDSLMNTVRFCEYHKKVADLDANCAVCFPGHPPKP